VPNLHLSDIPASSRTAGLAPQPEVRLQIRRYQDGDQPQWDAYALRHPHASPFHLIAWKRTLEESFGYQAMYLMASGESGVTGVLPLFLVRNPVVGRALISTPFAVYGGILADSAEVRLALYDAACQLGRELSVDYIELRNAWPEQVTGEANVDRYVTFTQELVPEENALLQSLPKKTRNMVRKSLKEPFTMRCGITDPANLDRIHSRNMKRLGSPCFPRKYFARVLANFGPMVDIREVWLGREVMAVSMNFYFAGQMHTYHASADPRFNHLGPNTFMYFDHLRWAGANGYHMFDFGRSKKNTGTFEFKRHWNTTMRELPYEMILVKRKELPNFSPANPRFEAAIAIWKRLPLAVTRVLGPYLIRLFP